MKTLNLNGNLCVSLTYDEERQLAKIVMDCLSKRWVQKEFNEFLEKIYYLKCIYGCLLSKEEMDQLAKYLSIWEMKPFIPEDETSDIYITLDCYANLDKRNLERKNTIRLAWKEVWDEHEAFRKTADNYSIFPRNHTKEDPNEQRIREEKIRRFDNEVRRVKDDYAIEGYFPSHDEVVAIVADYIPID